jgi:hypothetical protein
VHVSAELQEAWAESRSFITVKDRDVMECGHVSEDLGMSGYHFSSNGMRSGAYSVLAAPA